jgi:nucleotide-binding universal stress UspA family protein
MSNDSVEDVMNVAEMQLQNVETRNCIFDHILMASDLSAAAGPALSFAAELAKLNRCKLSVVHVSYPDWRYEVGHAPETEVAKTYVRQRLDAVVDSLHAQLPVARMVRQSTSVVQAVLDVIAESGSDLLVIGTHGRGGFSKLALGSVAEELLRTASCPVFDRRTESLRS